MFLNSEQLFDRGMRHIDDYEVERAERIAKKLIAKHYSGGHELMGLVHELREDYDSAIASYRRGLELAPEVDLFWSRLGAALSNSKRYEEALDAYNRYDLASGSTGEAAYNIALVLWRQGKPEEALTKLECAGGVPAEHIDDVRGLCLIELDRAEEALNGPISDGVRVRGLAALGREAETRSLARKLLEEDHGDANARIALLQLGAPNPKSRYRVKVDGCPPGGPIPDSEKYRFIQSYFIDANSEDHAFELIRPFEPRATDLLAESIEVLDESPGKTAGVVFCRSGYTLYCVKPSFIDRLRSILGATVFRKVDPQ